MVYKKFRVQKQNGANRNYEKYIAKLAQPLKFTPIMACQSNCDHTEVHCG